MIKLLFWCLLIYICYRIVTSLKGSKSPQTGRSPDRSSAAPTYLDPVCGVYVSEEDAVIGRLDGQRHYFCSRACLDKFQQQQLDHTP